LKEKPAKELLSEKKTPKTPPTSETSAGKPLKMISEMSSTPKEKFSPLESLEITMEDQKDLDMCNLKVSLI